MAAERAFRCALLACALRVRRPICTRSNLAPCAAVGGSSGAHRLAFSIIITVVITISIIITRYGGV